MRKALFLLLIVIVAGSCGSSTGSTPKSSTASREKVIHSPYRIRQGHPRIFLNSERLADVRARCADKKNAQAKYYAILKDFADKYTPSESRPSDYDCICLAFLYAVGEVPGYDYSKRSVDQYGKLGAEILIRLHPPEDLSYYASNTPNYIASYDWLFPVMTPKQRAIVFENFTSVAGKMRSLPGTTGQFRETRENYAYYGLVFFGDGKHIYPDDPRAAEAADRKAREYTDFFVSYWIDQNLQMTEASGKGGAYSAGTMYGESPYPIKLWHLDAWATAGDEDLYKKTSALTGYPLSLLYQVIPYRTHVRNDNASGAADQPNAIVRFGDYRYIGYTAAVSRSTIANIAQAQGVASRQGRNSLSSVYNWLIQYASDSAATPFGGPFPTNRWVGAGPQLVWDIIFRNGLVQAKSPAEVGLLLAHHFGTTSSGPSLMPDFPNGRPEGAGIVVMRSSWDDPAGTLVWFKASSYPVVHSHEDQGSFQVYKKGWLAIDSGQYEETPHRGNYASRTVAHNSLLIYNPEERRGNEKLDPIWHGYANDGGQRLLQLPKAAEQLSTPEYFLGGITRFESVDGVYDYAHADITRSYNAVQVKGAGNDAKVSLVTRSLFFLRPDEYLVVFDRVTSMKAEYPKRWLLHSIYRPELNGTETFDGVIPYSKQIPRMSRGVQLSGNRLGGISESRDTDMFTIRGWDFGPTDGRLVVRSLLPEKRIHRIVGGADKKGKKKTALARAYAGGDTIYVRDAEGFEPGDFVYIGVTDRPYSYGNFGGPSWPVDDILYVGWGSVKSVDMKTGAINLRPYGYSIPNQPQDAIVVRSDHGNEKSFEFMDAEYHQWPMHGESVANAGPFQMQHGVWRVEVEPLEPRKDDLFLHVMLPCDKDTLSQSQALLKEKVKMTRTGNDIILEIVGKVRSYKIVLRANSPDAHITVTDREKTIVNNELTPTAIKSRTGK